MNHADTSPAREAELRRIAAVTCDQDRGEDPFAWSELPPPSPAPAEPQR